MTLANPFTKILNVIQECAKIFDELKLRFSNVARCKSRQVKISNSKFVSGNLPEFVGVNIVAIWIISFRNIYPDDWF